jgi:hypothetical protein
MNGLLDFFKTPEGQGLLSGAFGYAANANRNAPINSLGRGGLAGMIGYSQATDRDTKQKQFEQQQAIQNQALERQRQTDALADQQRQRVEAYGQTLPEDQRMAFMVDPKAFLTDANKKYTVGGNLVTGSGRSVFEAPVENKIGPNGQVYNPREIKPGQVFADPNKPFSMGPQGAVPNLPFQNFELNKARSGATNVNVSTGVKKVDENFARDFVDFATGGYADTVKQLDQLREVSGSLNNESGLTGPVVGNIPRGIRNVTNPQSVATQEAVEEVVQRNLRLILGAQFTEKEGERLISRAYNPALSQGENKKRVDRLIQQIESAAQSKLDASRYFMSNGTLEGWKGKVWRMEDFDPEGKLAPKNPQRRSTDSLSPAEQRELEELRRRFGR